MDFINRRTKRTIGGLILVVLCMAVYDKYTAYQESQIMRGTDHAKIRLLEKKKTLCTKNALTMNCTCLNRDTGQKVEKTQEQCNEMAGYR